MEREMEFEESEVPAKGGLCGPKCRTRYLIAILLSVGMGLIYGLKVAPHVAIVAMVNNSAFLTNESDHAVSPCVTASNTTKAASDGPFLWNPVVVGWLLSSYFYGYMASELPGGRIAETFSARWVFFAAVLVNIVCHLLTPAMAKLHWGAMLAMRVLQGIGGGMTFPSAHVLLAHWAPPAERSVLSNIVYAGTCLGTVVFMLVSGEIAGRIGWEEVFYIEGGVSALWLVLWAWLSADTPSKLRRIAPEERAFITDSLKAESGGAKKEHPPVPWKKVFTSKPFLAILIAHTCSNWGWYMVLIELPQYMTHALGFNIKENAALAALPFLTMWIFSMCLSKLLDHLRAAKKISTTWSRKVATLIASVVPALCLTVLCIIECDPVTAVVLMTVAITGIGGMFSGFLSNHIDIAPNYAGTLMALTNTVATIPGILVPIVVGQLTEHDPSLQSWRTIFIVTVVLYIVEILTYTIFGSGEVQEWNKI